MANAQGSSRAQGSAIVKNPLFEVGSILVFALGVFALFALATYHPTDPSLFSISRGATINACGRVGAWLSSLMLQCFGMGAFLLPAAIFFVSATIHRREGSVRVLGILGGMSIAVVSLTVFVTLQWKYWPFSGTLMLTGGAFGAWIAESLMKQFNPLGSSIVSIVVFCLALALSTPVSVAQFGARVLRILGVAGYRSTRVIGTYFLYLSGLFAMRLAHSASDAVQKAIDGSLEKAKAAKAAAKAAKANAKLGLKPDGTQLDKAAAGAPVIGLEHEDEEEETDSDSENGTDSDTDVDTDTDDSDRSAIDIFALRATMARADTGASKEAPNALPELEKLAAASRAALTPAQGELQILPRATGNADAGKQDLAAKVAEKMARAAARVKKGQWKLPTIDFLAKPPKIESAIDKDRLLANSEVLRQKFADFEIEGQVTAVRPGPVITLYEFKPAAGIKVSRISGLVDDITMAMEVQSVRILAPLPGKPVVGIEIPSEQREKVFMREFLQHPDFYNNKHALPVVMGKDIAGQTYLSDLARMPHLLCAGQTGAGKSVFINGLICSLLYRFTPDELRLILVDPKVIEFRAYQDIPHLLLPVVDDPKNAATALRWAVREMERRYRVLAKMEARNLAGFNQKVDEMGADVVRDLLLAEQSSEEDGTTPLKTTGADWIEAFEPDENGNPRIGKLPYIVVIIDELADLMMIAKKEVEVSIARIAQKARAAGIHLVIATQRPSTDVVTGLIKANLPSRVSFQLASFIDSKTILDRPGAERLLGQGDMLFIPPGVGNPIRLHGAFVDDDEITKITSFLRAQGKPCYREEILIDDEDGADGEGSEGDDPDDSKWEEALEIAKRSGQVSASSLQRHLKVGYNRAARMIEKMESRGIVGPADGARPREVLVR